MAVAKRHKQILKQVKSKLLSLQRREEQERKQLRSTLAAVRKGSGKGKKD